MQELSKINTETAYNDLLIDYRRVSQDSNRIVSEHKR